MLTAVRLAAWTPLVQAALRIMTGLLFLAHGTQKLLQFPAGGPPPGPDGGLPPLLLIAGLLELVGGALFAAGFMTRITAFILSGMMAVAYFMAHASRGFFPTTNGGDPAILFCFIFLFFAVAGPGAFALDNLRNKPAAA